jgi:hypothetical protein
MLRRTPLKRGTSQLKRSAFKSKPTVKVKKPKEKNITWHRKKLWSIFSKWIRERDNYTCFTCGKKAEGSGMHAGHFITGATCTAKLYFDEMNVHAQCYHDNINLSGNWVVYEKKMIEKYGKEKVDELKLRRTLEMGHKVDITWYQDKIKQYEM